MKPSNGFLADGCLRARAALRPIVRREVNAEYAERLAKADLRQRAALHKKIEAEIERRLEQSAPMDALY